MSTEATSDLFFYDDSTHTYKVGNTVYPSVTQVIAAAGLMDWLYQVRPDIRDAACERGNRVHEVVALINQGKDWVRSEPFAELDYFGESGYINAYLEWLEASKFTVARESVEKKFYNRERRFAGRIDFLGLTHEDRPATVDVKSGGFESAARLQLAAYQNANGPNTRDLLPQRIVLRLKRDGTYNAHPLPIAENSIDWHAFTSALNVYHWKQQHHPTKERKTA